MSYAIPEGPHGTADYVLYRRERASGCPTGVHDVLGPFEDFHITPPS
jgi:hypothetical protein